MITQLRNQEYKMTLFGLLKLECISLYGRLFLRRKAPIKLDNKNYLHLGCGNNPLMSHSGGGILLMPTFSLILNFIKSIKLQKHNGSLI